jgi:hypothetical protein
MQDSNSLDNSRQLRQPSDNVDALSHHRPAGFWERALAWLIRLFKGLCCAFSIIWLAFIALCTILCFTSGLTPIGKAVVATMSVAAVIPILLLLDGKRKYVIGVPCLFVAGWIVWFIWQTRDMIGIGPRIGKQTNHRMMEIGLALHWYNDRWGHLPFPVRCAALDKSVDWHERNGKGKPLYSWRVAILPLPRSWDPDQPWDVTSNRDLLKRYVLFSYCFRPDDEATFPDTMALAITGPGTAFGDGTGPPEPLEGVPPQAILVVESRVSGIPWPAPGDFDIRTMPRSINALNGKGISGFFPEVFQVVFADGQVWLLSKKVPFETLNNFFRIEDAKKHDREKLLGPYALDRRE